MAARHRGFVAPDLPDLCGRRRTTRRLGFDYRDAAAIVNPALLAKLPERPEPGGQGLLWGDETNTTNSGHGRMEYTT